MTTEAETHEVRSSLELRRAEVDAVALSSGNKYLMRLPGEVKDAVAQNLVEVEQIKDLETLFREVDTIREMKTGMDKETREYVIYEAEKPGLPMTVTVESGESSGDEELDAINRQYKKLNARGYFDHLVTQYTTAKKGALPQDEAEMKAADALKSRLATAKIKRAVTPIIMGGGVAVNLPFAAISYAHSLGQQALKPTEAPLQRKAPAA